MIKIFINYRRSDSKSEARLLYQDLIKNFKHENVVMDIDTIPPSIDFRAFINQAVKDCDVFLALIGPGWMEEGNLEDANDWVRIEIEAALENNRTILPILINEGTMPKQGILPKSIKQVANLNGLHLDTGADYNHHIKRITKWINEIYRVKEEKEEINFLSKIELERFVNGEKSNQDQLDFFIKQIGLASDRRDFKRAQFKTYSGVWRSLQALRLKGDDLWADASTENLGGFASQLRETNAIVHSGEIFFEEKDRLDLLEVLTEFSKYKFEKTKLIEFDQLSEQFIAKESYSISKIQDQIATNRQHKIRYEKILEDIRVSFRNQLSSH